MKVWAIEDESVVMKAEIYHNEEITCFNTSPKGTLLITGSADLSLKLWQINTGFLMQVKDNHIFFYQSINYQFIISLQL